MHIHIGWPQAIYMTIYLVSTVYTVGKSVRGGDTVGGEVFGHAVGFLITFGLLYWGGFFG